MPNAVEFSVSIDVGGCLCPISSSVLRSGIVVCTLWKSAPNKASAYDATTLRSIQHSVCIGPFFIIFLGFLDGSADIEIKK